MALTVTGELMVGGWTKEANPRLTMSLVDGGKAGAPWTAAQLPAVSQAVLTAPIHPATLALAAAVHRPTRFVKPLCSTQLAVASLALLPEAAQAPAFCHRAIVDSSFPFNSGSW